MEQALATSVTEPRFRTISMALFAGVALILATIGIYGVIAYTVSQRTQEIGVRMALGAQRQDILRMVMGQGLRLTLIGLAIGMTSSFALAQVIAALLFGVRPTDVWTFLAVIVLICGVAMMACYVPARRAMQIDPLTALRYE